MVKMKGGSSGAIIGLIIFSLLLLFIGGGIGLYFLFKCAKVIEECEDDNDCCETLKCEDKKCCSSSTKVCSKDNECCGTLECKDKKCTESTPEESTPEGSTPYCGGRLKFNGKCNDHNNAGKERCDNAYQTIDNALCKWDVGTIRDSCEKDPNGKYCDFK